MLANEQGSADMKRQLALKDQDLQYAKRKVEKYEKEIKDLKETIVRKNENDSTQRRNDRGTSPFKDDMPLQMKDTMHSHQESAVTSYRDSLQGS